MDQFPQDVKQINAFSIHVEREQGQTRFVVSLYGLDQDRKPIALHKTWSMETNGTEQDKAWAETQVPKLIVKLAQEAFPSKPDYVLKV